MHEALVENAEDDVHGEERRHDERRLAAERLLIGEKSPREEAAQRRRRVSELRVLASRSMALRRSAERHVRGRG